MKKLIKKFAIWLYLKCVEPDLVAITRKQLQGLTEPVRLIDLDGESREVISNEAKTVLKNVAFQLAVNNIKNSLLRHIQLEAPDIETIKYDRFSINGVSLIEDELNFYVEELQEYDGEFDPHEML